MSVELWVEGKLDAELLAVLLAGAAAVSPRGGKETLRPQVKAARRGGSPILKPYYLRDRDFDSLPDVEPNLAIDASIDEDVLGWRWHRHSIECYLLEPQIVSSATGVDSDKVCEALAEAAIALASYEAARWVIGRQRAMVPPRYRLETAYYPENEFALPPDLGEDAIKQWFTTSLEDYRQQIQQALDPEDAIRDFHLFHNKFLDVAFGQDTSMVLTWYSGKDLLAHLSPIFAKEPGTIRSLLADWVLKHPSDAVNAWPEINTLKSALTK